jgi:hypothetical protein
MAVAILSTGLINGLQKFIFASPRPIGLSTQFQEIQSSIKELSFGFPYVRIDFYDLDGKVYFGEVTQHHGGGFDQIRPIEWDYKLGELVKLK